jgi:lysophospholipase L1-like esterase
MVSNVDSTPLCFYFDQPTQFEMVVTLYYVTKSGGGMFGVSIGDTPSTTYIATGNCEGNGIAKTLTFTLPANSKAWITPLDINIPVYVYGWTGIRSGVVDSSLVYNSSVGGRRLTDYSDLDLENTIKSYPSDLLIMALGANDYTGHVSINDFRAKLDVLSNIVTTIGKKSVLIILQCRAQVAVDEGVYRTAFEDYRNLLYNYAHEKGYAFLDIDRYLGGWETANDAGIMSDTIHPNALGHKIIGRVICDQLLGNIPEKKLPLYGENNGTLIDNIKTNLADKTFNYPTGLQAIYNNELEELSLKLLCEEQPFPDNLAEVGNEVFDTTRRIKYICTKAKTETTSAHWVRADGKFESKQSWVETEAIPAGTSLSKDFTDTFMSERIGYLGGRRAEAIRLVPFDGGLTLKCIGTDVDKYRLTIENNAEWAIPFPSGDYYVLFSL